VKEAAFKLKDNGISDVISSINSTSYAYDYYVVKMIKNQSKGDNLEKYKKELKEIATQTKVTNNEFINKTVGEELKAANVKIKDKDLTDVLQPYQTTDSSKTKTSDTKTTNSSK
jgi:foldase protein PrsA